MEVTDLTSDDALLLEIGRRLARRRLDLELTQAQLAEQAGVGKRTVERLEGGSSTQMSSFVRILRALDLLPGLELLFPEAQPSPMDLLRGKGKQRRRASTRRKSHAGGPWSWNAGS